MPPLVSTLLLACLVIIAFVLMWLGWRHRVQRDATLPALSGLEDLGGNMLGSCEIKYVATTHAEDPVQRVAALGLGIRGNGTLTVHSDGVFIARDGETDFAILNKAIVAVSPRDWAIDRGIGGAGLVGIDWKLGRDTLTTFVRTDTKNAQNRLFELLNTTLGAGIVTAVTPTLQSKSKEHE